MTAPGPVLVTGATGFVGRHFVAALEGAGVPCVPLGSDDCDLTDRDATLRCFRSRHGVRAIVHLASWQAAGTFPAEHTADQLSINGRMHLNTLEAWRSELPEARFVAVGTSCAYPGDRVPLVEDDYMDGAIHGSVYAYGLTKRLLYTGLRAIADQDGLNGSYVIPATMFGEYDDFHPDTAHVCGALINRFCRAAREGAPSVTVWGDGTQVRDLMDVREFVRVLLELLPRLDRDVVNIGPGAGTTIRDLASMIARAARFEGDIRFDAERYSGVSTKFLDTGRLESEFGLRVSDDHERGLARTAEWYERHWREYESKPKFACERQQEEAAT